MIYIRNTMVTTAKTPDYLGNAGKQQQALNGVDIQDIQPLELILDHVQQQAVQTFNQFQAFQIAGHETGALGQGHWFVDAHIGLRWLISYPR